MRKENIKELLEKQYDLKIEYNSLLDYYKLKLEEQPQLKYIYTTWISDLKDKIKSLDIEIQYLQKEIYS